MIMSKYENPITPNPGEIEHNSQRVLDYRRLDAEMKDLWKAYRDKKSVGESLAAQKLWNDMNELYEALYNNGPYKKKQVTSKVVDGLIDRSKRMREFLEIVN